MEQLNDIQTSADLLNHALDTYRDAPNGPFSEKNAQTLVRLVAARLGEVVESWDSEES